MTYNSVDPQILFGTQLPNYRVEGDVKPDIDRPVLLHLIKLAKSAPSINLPGLPRPDYLAAVFSIDDESKELSEVGVDVSARDLADSIQRLSSLQLFGTDKEGSSVENLLHSIQYDSKQDAYIIKIPTQVVSMFTEL